MINLIESDYEHLLPSPLLPKMDDPGMLTIHRSMNQKKLPEKLSATREHTLLNVKDGGPRPLTLGQCCAKRPH
jgi:hypothetical protein